MSVLLNSTVDPHKFTPLGMMFHVEQHKHAFPTSHGYIFPESVAPEDAAMSPDAEALNSKQSRPALTAKPHGHFNEKDYLAPGATLFSPKHLRKGQRRARVRRGEGEPLTTGAGTSPSAFKTISRKRHLGDAGGDQGPHLRSTSEQGPANPSTETWLSHLAQPPGKERCSRYWFPLPVTRSAAPALGRRTQCKHSAPPRPGGRSASADPHFCVSCHAPEKRRGGC